MTGLNTLMLRTTFSFDKNIAENLQLTDYKNLIENPKQVELTENLNKSNSLKIKNRSISRKNENPEGRNLRRPKAVKADNSEGEWPRRPTNQKAADPKDQQSGTPIEIPSRIVAK